ncbi:44018_t:CDS:1, partial [Gigaspora margarita]
YEEMIREAIIVLKERKGSSRQAIKKYITNRYRLEDNAVFNGSFRKALNKGVEKELFEFVNGPMGTIKLKKKVEKPRTMTKLDEPSERSKTKVSKVSKPKTTKKPSVVKDKKTVSKDATVKKPSTTKSSKKTSTTKSPKKTSTTKSTKKASTAKVPKKTSTVKVPTKSTRTRSTR